MVEILDIENDKTEDFDAKVKKYQLFDDNDSIDINFASIINVRNYTDIEHKCYKC